MNIQLVSVMQEPAVQTGKGKPAPKAGGGGKGKGGRKGGKNRS